MERGREGAFLTPHSTLHTPHLTLNTSYWLRRTTRPEINFRANSSSPLKWTKFTRGFQSSLEDFCYETGVKTPSG
jgi:hypothetical protein